MGRLKEAAWIVTGVIMELESQQPSGMDPVGRWVVRVVDRSSGSVVVENRWGHDHDTAQLDLQYVGRCLDTMAVDVFEQEYGIS
jgi:hypothetical protein